MTLTARQHVGHQVDAEISHLGLMMLRFDGWIADALARNDPDTADDLQAQRLAAQQRRSALMLERFAWRRRR